MLVIKAEVEVVMVVRLRRNVPRGKRMESSDKAVVAIVCDSG